VLKTGGVPECVPSQLEVRTALAHASDAAPLVAAIRMLWASRDKVRTDTDQLTAAQVTCALVADALVPEISKIVTSPTSQPINKVEKELERPLTLAEMAALAASVATTEVTHDGAGGS
jgi:hypothetical protein